MKKNIQKNTGLYLAGTVTDRKRRMVPRNDPKTEVVTYTFTDNNGKRYFVDDYAPDSYYETNEYAEIPVRVKAYRKSNGDISYTLSIQKEFQSEGESF